MQRGETETWKKYSGNKSVPLASFYLQLSAVGDGTRQRSLVAQLSPRDLSMGQQSCDSRWSNIEGRS